MNIKILDSWLKEYLDTHATPQKIAEVMSLTSVGIERIEPFKGDFVYDIEITTNRPDLMSVIGLAREAAVVLPQHGVAATFKQQNYGTHKAKPDVDFITIINDPKLVRRICAVKMDITLKDSPQFVKDRLESSDIRSLNNVIDVTNYVMRLTGHPTHVFDYDRLVTKKLLIRESKKGEKVTTLDGKTYSLPGGDIIGDNGKGEIIDLLGVMGTANSVITDSTKTILFFLDNVEPDRIRKTSMTLGIRTEAAVLNEKDLATQLTKQALEVGIHQFEKFADAKNISTVLDIYGNEPESKTIQLSKKKIATVVGTDIPEERSKEILQKLGFAVKDNQDRFTVEVTSARKDIQIPEDLIEEIARIYGYHNIPSIIPPIAETATAHLTDVFFWEARVKEAMRYWGFTEVYTYSMVNENLFEGELSDAVTIKNPLNDEMVYMRRTLVPSLLLTIPENKTREQIKIFEIANVYHKRQKDLPDEKLHFAGVIKKPGVSFYEVKGLFEQLATDLGIHGLAFKPMTDGSTGAELFIASHKLGAIEILDSEAIDFEVDFGVIIQHATVKKTFTPLAKHPPIIEDMTFVLGENTSVGDVLGLIKQQSKLIREITLIDKYKDTRTFRLVYQDQEKNLMTEDVAPVREKIAKTLEQKLQVKQK
jgi:phenylalanyl-tRNA synthetase beta chain